MVDQLSTFAFEVERVSTEVSYRLDQPSRALNH